MGYGLRDGSTRSIPLLSTTHYNVGNELETKTWEVGRMTRAMVCSVLSLSLLSIAAIAEEPGKAVPGRSPEDVMRAFVLAGCSKDEAALRQAILPTPGAEVLWQGPVLSKEAVLQTKAMLHKAVFRECKAGQTIDIPGEGKLRITDSMVDENRKMFLPVIDGRPMPPCLTLCLAGGKWKIDASDIIQQELRSRRIEKVAQLARLCMSYSDRNEGRIPAELSSLKNLPKDIHLEVYVIVARGNVQDYQDHGATILVREKKNDDSGEFAAGYLDGHADFRNPKKEAAIKAKGVRVVCNVCGAWISCASYPDKRASNFIEEHFAKCVPGKIGMVISIVHPSDERFETLKETEKVE